MGRISRRGALRLGATAATRPLVHIRTGRAAGRVSLGFWDHWVPAGNAVMKQQCDAWGAKNQVEVNIDFITSVGNKLVITQAAEAQAGTGHDALHFSQWEIHHHADKLVPVDEVVQRLTSKYGKANIIAEYLARPDGHWRAVPSSWGAQAKPPCARVSVMKSAAGIDVTQMYPVKAEYTPEMDDWTWEKHLTAAEA